MMTKATAARHDKAMVSALERFAMCRESQGAKAAIHAATASLIAASVFLEQEIGMSKTRTLLNATADALGDGTAMN